MKPYIIKLTKYLSAVDQSDPVYVNANDISTFGQYNGYTYITFRSSTADDVLCVVETPIEILQML